MGDFHVNNPVSITNNIYCANMQTKNLKRQNFQNFVLGGHSNVTQCNEGRGVRIRSDQRYEGARSNVISATRGRWVSNLQKNSVTLEWPLM